MHTRIVPSALESTADSNACLVCKAICCLHCWLQRLRHIQHEGGGELEAQLAELSLTRDDDTQNIAARIANKHVCTAMLVRLGTLIMRLVIGLEM